MAWPAIAFWLLVLPPLQSAGAPRAAIDQASPDLLLLFCLYVSLYARRRDVFVAVWLLGMMHDVYSQNPLGLQSLVYILLAGAVCAVREELFKEHVLTRMTLCAGGAAAVGAASLVGAAAVWPHISLRSAAASLLLAGAYTTLLCPAVWLVFDATRWLAGRGEPAAG